jgi:hypothetical protein
MKLGTGVELMLRLGLNSLAGCNVGVTDGSDL